MCTKTSLNLFPSQYSGKENPSLEASVDEQLIHFINLIQEKYLSSASLSRLVDFARIAQYFALDVITDVASGKPYGFIETDSDVHDYLKIQSILFPIFECFSTLPSLERLIRFPPISKAVMPTAKDSKGLGHLMGVAEDIVNDRYDKAEREVSQPDMLGSFIRHGLPREQAKIEAVLQVIAGSDTTVTALRMTVLSISTSSTVLREVLAEIDEADRSGKLSKPIALETEIRSHLPYLCACVKESLRLWPPVTGLFFKDVPQGGDVVDGAFLPGGTRLGYNAWALHRSKSLYGEDADIYRPSRWLEEAKDPDRLAEMTRSVDLIFGHGKYGCLGKPVALMELHKAVTEVSLTLLFWLNGLLCTALPPSFCREEINMPANQTGYTTALPTIRLCRRQSARSYAKPQPERPLCPMGHVDEDRCSATHERWNELE